ncbi:hypothetical protein ACI7YT_17925 [Microbacterium sp. M]|uniref:hypothetical protein n=1 Tax=Microbacterium sp. M TaxID=3377125 RepID=UPI00386690A0
MTDVAIFHADLSAAGSAFSEASLDLQFDITSLIGDDPGVEAPIGRNQLRAELNRRIDELHDAVFSSWESASALSSSAFAITSRYSELDEELSGEGSP